MVYVLNYKPSLSRPNLFPLLCTPTSSSLPLFVTISTWPLPPSHYCIVTFLLPLVCWFAPSLYCRSPSIVPLHFFSLSYGALSLARTPISLRCAPCRSSLLFLHLHLFISLKFGFDVASITTFVESRSVSSNLGLSQLVSLVAR